MLSPNHTYHNNSNSSSSNNGITTSSNTLNLSSNSITFNSNSNNNSSVVMGNKSFGNMGLRMGNNNNVNNNSNSNNSSSNNSKVRMLWNSYVQTVVYQESLFTLVEFLKVFIHSYQDTPIQLLSLSFGSSLSDVTRYLFKHFTEEINNCYVNSTPTNRIDIYQYLSGVSLAGEAPMLLTALDIITRHSCDGVPLSMVKLLSVLVTKVLSTISNNNGNGNNQNNSNINFQQQQQQQQQQQFIQQSYNGNQLLSSSMSSYSGNNNFNNNFNSSQNSYNSQMMMMMMSASMSNMQLRNSSKHSVNIKHFQPISNYFHLSPLPPSLYSDQSVKNSSPPLSSLTSIPPPPNQSLDGGDGVNQEQQIPNSNNNISGGGSTFLQQTLPGLASSFMDNSALIGGGSQQQNNISLTTSQSSTTSNNNSNGQFINNGETSDLNNGWKSNQEVSPDVFICFQLLKILGNIVKDRQCLNELLKSDCINILANIFNHRNTTNDPSFAIIHSQLIRIFAQIMSSCCVSSESMNLIHEKKIIEKLLNVLSLSMDQEKKSLSITTMIEISQVIIYTIKSSSRLMVSLHDDFDSNNGYSILLNTFVHIADNGTLKNKLDIINVACNLIFIQLKKDLLTDSNLLYQPNNISKTSLKVFNIFINVFSITKSEETKSELLKCMKGIFYLSLANDSYNHYDSTINNDDTIGIFHQLEPFQIFFTQFDNLNISNRKLILEMMDELLLKNQIKKSELCNYVSLFDSKLPSTVLLVSQHLTELLSKSKINKDILKEVGIVQTLQGYLTDQHKLPFFANLDKGDELNLCFQLIPGKHFQQPNKLFVLYRIIISILNLLLEFFSNSQDIQSHFIDSGGLKLLYRLLPDEYLIQPSLQVIATLAIGRLRIESKIISDLISVLQNSGGSTTLDSKILTMRKNILAAMCYILHNNPNAKQAFTASGGFIWCVSILDGISRCVNSNNSSHKSKSNSTNNNEIFFFLKVLIDTLSAVMKNNPTNQTYFREEIQFSTLSNTLKACGYMEGVYSASLCDSLLNMAVCGSWPPSCEQHSLEEGSLLSIYSPLTSFFPPSSPLNISKSLTFENLPFINQNQNQNQNNNNNNNTVNSESPITNNIYQNSPFITGSPLSPSRRGRGRSYTNDFDRSPMKLSISNQEVINGSGSNNNGNNINGFNAIHISEGDVMGSSSTQSSLDLAAEVRGGSVFQMLSSTSRLPEKSSLALAQDRHQSCQSCRDSLMIENPEIFKLIIRLMGGTDEDIQKIETKASCYILKEIIFLVNVSLTNQKKLSSFLIDIVDYFKPILTLNKSTTNSILLRKSESLKPLLLELLQSLAGHSLTLGEFRKYFELLRSQDYPLDLLSLMVKISSRDNIPTYYAELSKSSLECIDFPTWGEKSWPPLKGYGLSFWFRYSPPILKVNKSPIYLLSIEGVIIGSGSKSCETQLVLDNGILVYRIQTGMTVEQFSFSEFPLEPDTFYHVCLTHNGLMPGQGQKKTPIKLYVNGCLRSQFVLGYPKTQQMTLYVRFGAPNAAGPVQDYLRKSSWHLGNAYFFEDLPSEKELFYLYLLGPDHFRGLKVDISSIENIQPYMDKSTKLHPNLIEHLLSPTTTHLYSLHDKIISIFSAKCLYVTKSHRIANKSEAITHASAQPQQALNDSLGGLMRRSQSVSEASLMDSMGGSSTVGGERASFAQSLSGSSKRERSTSSLTNSQYQPVNTVQSSSSLTQSIGLVSTTMLTITSAITPTTSGGLTQQLSNSGNRQSLNASSLVGIIGQTTTATSATNTTNNQMVNNTLSLLQTGLPIPLPYGVICQRGVADLVIDSGGVSVIIYLMAVSNDKEYQRAALKMLQSIVHNNQQNIKDMKDVYGYQLVSHLIRKKNWVLDDGLLSILFSFVGVTLSRTSIHYSNIDGVVQDVLALKYFLLEWEIWRNAQLLDQKKLFESLEKLVSALHDNHDFNIIKFRQAGAFETILKICREDDLVLEFVPLLMSILRSIIHKPPKIKEDLQLLVAYLFSTSPKAKPPNTPSGSSHRRKKSNTSYLLIQAAHNNSHTNSPNNNNSSYNGGLDSSSPPGSGNSTPNQVESVRVSILTLLLDILSKSEQSVIEDFHSLCNLESIFGLLVNESVATRILFLKIVDLYLHVPSILIPFQKMKGFHILGQQLLSYPLTEEIFGVLFCLLFGKSYNSDIDPILSVSMQMYFLSQISSDTELKYPGVVVTILIILQNCSSRAQHIVIKMIHNVFLQSDQFKQILLEQELIPRLVDILASNASKRQSAQFQSQFNRNIMTPNNINDDLLLNKEDNWQSEESILSLLKEIALYGAKSQEATTLLRDILVILHLNTRMDFDYVCCLQRRVLYDVISFFNENNFGTVDSLVSSFEKICILSIHTLCYQEKTVVANKRLLSSLKSSNNISSTNISMTSLSAYNTPNSTPQKIPTSPEVSDQSSNNEQVVLSSNDESTEESDSSVDNSFIKKKKSKEPVWIKDGNLFNVEAFITLLINVLSNNKVPQSTNSTYRSLFTTQYSARSLLGKLIYILFTSYEFNDHHLLVLNLLVNINNNSNQQNLTNSATTTPTTTTTTNILDFISEEDLLVVVYITSRLHYSNDPEIVRLTTQLWNKICQGVSLEFGKKVFDQSNWTSTNSAERTFDLGKLQASYVEMEYKKWEERNNQSKKEWKLQYLETHKNKQVLITKNQDIAKTTKRLMESLLQLKIQYEKANIQYQYENRESKRFFHNQWKLLIKRVTHERAIWELPPPTNKWKLDPTEGAMRMRTRLKRITLKSELNISIPEYPSKDGKQPQQVLSTPPPIIDVGKDKDLSLSSESSLTSPTGGLNDSYSSFDNLKLGEKLSTSFPCSCISPFYQRDGELLIGEFNVYFMDELLSNGNQQQKQKEKQRKAGISSQGKHITMCYEDIIEIHKRRHVLKNSAIEIFLGSAVPHKTYLFAFSKPSDRDVVYDLIMSKPLPNRVDYAAEVQGNILKMSITKKWQRGMISNFEYLMHLNTLAGRTFNDLTQYPIFPFILKDYESSQLDLENPDTFRDLSKPMGAQDPQRLKKFVEKYNYLLGSGEKPYHYGSHYSNIGSVLHFLVRLQPFSSYFIEFQGGRFDVPDRAFHSIAQSWRLSSSISSSDVKELIPEFFYLPDFLTNSNQFNMGMKQDGVNVDDVVLPPWANNDPKLFIKKHIEALECRYVSENLNNWIDLMFGYKQQGEAAVKAHNMFFPLTYEGAVDIDSIEDQLTRDATIAQIHSYGQTPKQLFTKPHPQKNWRKLTKLIQDSIYYKPEKLTNYTMWSIRNPVGSIGLSGDTPIPLPTQKILLYPDSNKYVSWGHWDQNLRINSIDTGKVLSLIEVFHNDDIICCDITKNGRLFVSGGTSGTIKVWKRCNNDGTLMTRKERGDNLSLWSQLFGHTNSILCITVSQEFSIIVSGSKDNTCIVWDLNRLTYVHSLPHENPVTCVQVSPTTNYIATSETSIRGDNGALRLWNATGQLIAKYNIQNDRINCMTFTAGIEGVVTNLLITGMESGVVILWDSSNLTKIRVLNSQSNNKNPITAIAVSKDHSQLIVGDSSGLLECWSNKLFDGYASIVM